eukprot:scaffold2007_cov110-Skeletonema_dohrnii-CCMP3373.AAC.1
MSRREKRGTNNFLHSQVEGIAYSESEVEEENSEDLESVWQKALHVYDSEDIKAADSTDLPNDAAGVDGKDSVTVEPEGFLFKPHANTETENEAKAPASEMEKATTITIPVAAGSSNGSSNVEEDENETKANESMPMQLQDDDEEESRTITSEEVENDTDEKELLNPGAGAGAGGDDDEGNSSQTDEGKSDPKDAVPDTSLD